jgi:uncharacterized protein YndB with AHSA1/START domain
MTSLTLVRRIAARPAIVFAALTTAEGLAGWWGPDAGPVLLAEIAARRRALSRALSYAGRDRA